MRTIILFLLGVCCALCVGMPAYAAEADAFLFAAQPERNWEPDGVNGPWVYRSDDLTVVLTRCKTETERRYVKADIFLRNGTTFYSGAANMQFGTGKTEMPYAMSRRYQAVLGLTGDYLSHWGNAKGVMIRNGVVYYDKRDADTMAFLPDGSMKLYPQGSVTAEELLALGVKDSYAFGPIVVLDGAFHRPALQHNVAASNRRCSLGMVDANHYIAITSNSTFSAQQLGELFLSYGCTQAYNLDGGSSSVMVYLGERVNYQTYNQELQVLQRPLPDMLLLGHSALVPAVDAPVRYTNDLLGKAIR